MCDDSFIILYRLFQYSSIANLCGLKETAVDRLQDSRKVRHSKRSPSVYTAEFNCHRPPWAGVAPECVCQIAITDVRKSERVAFEVISTTYLYISFHLDPLKGCEV